MAHQTFFKSDMTPMSATKDAKRRAALRERALTYRAVEIRDGMKCRACRRGLVRQGGLAVNSLEHHHVAGRGGPDAETTGNIALLCRGCHEARHVTRVLHISGDANDLLTFTHGARTWQS